MAASKKDSGAGSVTVVDYNSASMSDLLSYNPRCLTRDINSFWTRTQAKKSNVEILLSCPNVDCLEKRADGLEVGKPPVALLHAAGHNVIGGLNNDPFSSPGDPVFFLHHAMLDHVWAIWQAQDWSKRKYEVAGTKTALNSTSP